MRINILKEKVKKVLIRNYKVINNADIEFKDGLNMVIGLGATGKTILLDYLMKDNVELSKSEKDLLILNGFLGEYETLLVDDLLSRLEVKNKIKLLNKLAKSNKQIIIVGNYGDEKYIIDKNNEFKCNIIDTREFELKQ